MRVLVTGGAGFIGSHVLRLLTAEGHHACALDDLSSGRTEHVPRQVPLHVASVTTPAVDAIVARFAPDAIVHLAAQMDVRASGHDPVHDADVNVAGTVRVLHAAAAHDVPRVVFASSGGTVYGEGGLRPVDESCATLPLSPYGAAKRSAEIYVDMFARTHGGVGVSLRLGNVYGPGQSAAGEAGVTALFAHAMLRGTTPRIFGDGLQTRDYVYVEDVAQAVLRALTGDNVHGTHNIGTGVGTSIVALYRELCEQTGFVGAPEHLPARAGEVRHIVLDAGQAHDVLGWRPTVSLRQGLAHTVAAMRRTLALPAPHPSLLARLGEGIPARHTLN